MAVFAAIFILTVPVSGAEEKTLIAAGIPLGVNFHIDGILVTGLCSVGEEESSPAQTAGLRRGDIISSVNGEKVENAEQLCEIVEASGGKALTLIYSRAGREMHGDIFAKQNDEGKYRIGIMIKDGASGIGTVTYIDPETLDFAALGHGICDTESGVLLPISGGTAEEVSLSGITQGKAGAPGELHGFFIGKQSGVILSNTALGVKGKLNKIPTETAGELFPIGKKEDLHEGKAYIYTTVDGDGRQKYEIDISKIDVGGTQKNFTVRITDPALLEKTGGIVRGMSGSPVIQDGYLVGAVTHVLISDPACGYGIFIENMINSPSAEVNIKIAA